MNGRSRGTVMYAKHEGKRRELEHEVIVEDVDGEELETQQQVKR